MERPTDKRVSDRSPTGDVSAIWYHDLMAGGAVRDAAAAQLHALLLKVARSEANRRRPTLPARVHDELDDLSAQAASDALMNVLRKLDEFRGESRFSTWASKFAIFETSTRLRRHAWRQRASGSDSAVWETLADTSPTVQHQLESRELAHALEQAVAQRLTTHQRAIFEAVVLNDTPIDVLAEQQHSSRGAIYKTLHDARKRLRVALAEGGFTEESAHG